jgi:hypothetical protein
MASRDFGLVRRRVWSDPGQEPRQYSGASMEADFTTYHSLLPILLNGHIDRSGVIQGLQVTQDNSKIITISPGVAADSQGRLIVLAQYSHYPAASGYAFFGVNKEKISCMQAGLSIGIKPDSENFNKQSLLTIEYAENTKGRPPDVEVELIPWLRLIEKSEADSDLVVLASITFGPGGEILSISHTDGTNQRQVITHALGGINIMCPQTNSGEVSQVIAGEIRPAKDGKGIEIDCILRVRDIVFIDDSPE